MAPPLSLDEGWDDEDERRPHLCPPCPHAPSEAALLARMQVEAAVARLPRRWQHTIRLRFALDGGEPCTVKEAAELLGIHRNSAHQIEKAALARLEQLMRPKRRRPQAGG
jgi:DNA-directed RNA polymerase sigma subunit (sigma70/sigma32)